MHKHNTNTKSKIQNLLPESGPHDELNPKPDQASPAFSSSISSSCVVYYNFSSCQAVLLHLRSGEETDIGPGACDDGGPVCQVSSLSLCAYMRTPTFFFWLNLWIWLKPIFKMAKHIWVFFLLFPSRHISFFFFFFFWGGGEILPDFSIGFF